MAAGVGTAGNLSTIYNIYTCRVSAGPLVARYPLFVQPLLFAREHFYPEMVQQATTQCGTIFRQILCGNVMLPVVRDKQHQSLPLGMNLRRPICTVKLRS